MNFKTDSCNYSFSNGFRFEKEDKPTLRELQADIETLKQDIYNIKYMKLSDSTKKNCISELIIQIRGLKNKMHDLIEEL